EIRTALEDLRKAAVDIVTLGQYLRPSEHHTPVARWVNPVEFAEWKRIGEQELGFQHVESGPLVRSSYHAEKQARTVQAGGPGEIRDILEADVPAPSEVVGLTTPATAVGSALTLPGASRSAGASEGSGPSAGSMPALVQIGVRRAG